MKTKQKLTIGILFAIALWLINLPLYAKTQDTDLCVLGSVYSGQKDYSCFNEDPFSESSLGKLSLNATVEDRYTISRTSGYGVKAGETVSFRYDVFADTTLRVCDDSYDRSVTWSNGAIEKLDASVRHGSIIILKRVNGEDSFTRVATAVDVFGEGATDTDAFYSCAPEDIQKGCSYAVLVLYATYEDENYCRYLEEYSLYISLSKSLVLIQPLSLSGMSYSIDNEFSSQMLQVGCTLQDGSVIDSGFKLVNKGDYNNQIFASYNGKPYQRVSDGTFFRQIGVYNIKTVSVDGEEEVRTVYITPPIEDAPALYFKNPQSPISPDTRVFAYEDCPVYRDEIVIGLCDVDPLPVMQGVLTKLPETEGAVAETRNMQADESGIIRVNEEGRWLLELYNGDPSRSGTFFKVTFYFMITHNYEMGSVNKYLLDHQNRIMNHEMLHLEVLVPTAGGGTLHICFDNNHYEYAYDCAYNLEMRYVTDSSNLQYRGVTYESYPEMMRAINQNVKNSIGLRIYDPSTVYPSPATYIEDIGTYSIAEDEYLIFTSEKEYTRSLTRIISPEFEFTHVPYQCEKATATCRHCNSTVDLCFGVPVKELLHHGSWKINEFDAQGNITCEYEIDVILENTVEYQLTTESTTERYWGIQKHEISQACRINEFKNFYDTEGVAIIINHTLSQTHIFAIAHLQEITIFNGNYTIILKDRVGNCMELHVDVPKENEKPGKSYVVHDGIRNILEKIYVSEPESTVVSDHETTVTQEKETQTTETRGCVSLVSSLSLILWVSAAGVFLQKKDRKEDNR